MADDGPLDSDRIWERFKSELVALRDAGASANLLTALWRWGPDGQIIAQFMRARDDGTASLHGLIDIYNVSIEKMETQQLQEAAE